MGGSHHPPEVLDPNQQAQGRRVKRVSLSLGELVLPAPQASRVESPGGVGVKVGGLGPTSWQGGYSQVFAVTQLLLSRVCQHIFVSWDWERPGSSGLGMPRRAETPPKLPGCRDVFPPIIHSPLPEVKESRVPPAQSSGRQNQDLAGVRKSRSWEVGAEVSSQPGLQQESNRCPVHHGREREGGGGSGTRGWGGTPTPRFTTPLCV